MGQSRSSRVTCLNGLVAATCSGMMKGMKPLSPASRDSKDGSRRFRVILIVRCPGCPRFDLLGDRLSRQVASGPAASGSLRSPGPGTGSPLWNLNPSRSRIRQVRPSSEGVAFAICGLNLLSRIDREQRVVDRETMLGGHR